jgi:hypothetical protein
MDSFAFAKRPQLPQFSGKVIHDFGETDPFAGGHLLNPQPFGIQTDVFQQFLAEVHHAIGVMVSIGYIVAFVKMTPADKHPIRSI